MIGQVAAWVVLLAIGCNVITGVGDLKVSDGCSPDAGQACDPGTSEMEGRPLEPPPDDGTGGAGFDRGDAGTGSGGNEECAESRDLPMIFGPSDAIGVRPAGACGSGGIPIGVGGNNGAGGTAGQNGAGAGGADDRPPPVAVRGSIAAACATDSDCADGQSCTTFADIDGPFGDALGGPQNGYCSRSCNTDAECQAADPGAICLGPGNGLNYCFASCDVTAPSFPAQCNGRDDLTCIPVSLDFSRSYCAPACHDDAACAPRFCSLATGLCQDEQPTGKPIGAGCATGDECAGGGCVSLHGQPSACTGLCTFGSTAGCGVAAGAVLRDAACLDTALGSGLGPGLCTELCDVAADCEQQAAGWVCTPWPLDVVLDYALTFARVGFCELAAGGSGGGGGGGAGGAGAGGTGKCTEECLYSSDGDCDDGGPGALTDICLLGTDCFDCGAR
ncbi:MAG: hypothetical protein ABI895_07840 [Deltaproteobacteria bacterium]